MKDGLRTAIGRVLAKTGAMQLGLRGHGVIVAFHRVNDRTAGDELTRGTRDYEDFCRFFKRYFDVVPLAEMIDRLERGDSIEGQLVITHDDGYLDNFEQAAPILSKLGLPATFFITSRFMESEVVPWWDEGIAEPLGWMSWDQVRQMRDGGFEIGAHTCHHVDLGVVPLDEAREELVTSKQDLERELGDVVDLFAYPFGRADNIRPETRALVREAGYRTCLSCHGGLARNGGDPFELERVPISPWYANTDHLAAALGMRRA